jgi:hypothetical protein
MPKGRPAPSHLRIREAVLRPVPTGHAAGDSNDIGERVLELVYTSWDMQPFARDLGYEGPPFAWDVKRRALLRAELAATASRASSCAPSSTRTT